MTIFEKIKNLGLELPAVSTPGGNYTSVNIRGQVACIAIQFPIFNGAYHYQGRLGEEITSEAGYKAMQLCALNVIAQVQEKIGFEKVGGLHHIDVCYQAVPGWDEAPQVADGASDLFVNVLEEKGTHSRAIFGVQALPRNFCAGLTSSFSLLNNS